MDIIKIGNYIRDKRKELNLTQNELAIKLAVSHQAVSRWEKGDNLPDVEKLSELAELFNVTVDHIINQGKEKKPQTQSENQLSFFTLINGLFVVIATILFYLLALNTARYWIGYVVQYVLVIGVSLIYIIPYAKIKQKTSQDFTYVRYGILTSISSVTMTSLMIFFGLSQLFLSLFFGTIFAFIVVFVVNLLLSHYQSKQFQLEMSQVSKMASIKMNQRAGNVLLCIFGAITLIAITGFGADSFTTDVLNDTNRNLGLGFGALLLLTALSYSIPTMFKSLKKKDYYNFVYALFFTLLSSFIMLQNIQLLNLRVGAADNRLYENQIYLITVSTAIMFLVTIIKLIRSYLKSRKDFFRNNDVVLITTLLIILLLSAHSYSLGWVSIEGNQAYTHHYVFEESLILVGLYVTATLYVMLPDIKNLIKKIR